MRDRQKEKVKTYEGRCESSAEESYDIRSGHPASGTETGSTVSPSGGESARIKTRDSVYGSSSANHSRIDSGRFEQSQVKTRDAYIQRQGSDAQLRKQKSVMTDTALPGHQSSQPVEQGRQKFVQKRQAVAVPQAKNQRRIEHPITAQRGDKVDIPRRQPPTLSVKPGDRPTKKAVRETVSSGKRQIKAARSGVKATGRTSRQTVKTAERTARTAVRTAEHGAKTARATAKATQQAMQTARATAQTAATSAKAVVKAAVSAQRWARAAIRAAMAPLSAAGGAVIAIVLVICMVGAIVKSPLGIFFSGGGGNHQIGQTISTVVREINQEYDARVETLKASTVHDELSLSGSRALWPEVLAVYAVKTTSDPTNGLEVVTMDDTKKKLLKQVFWDMNELSSFTSTVPGEDDEEGTTTLHITVTAKTASEMADIYSFNAEQRQQLAELLSDEYRELWSAVLYGTGTGSGEIVTVALSQVGNVGGQPYWSWYGFSSRVDWCAIFVSWCANECGYIDTGVMPKFAGCVQGSRWFKERGLWQDRSYTPNPGDAIFFDWDDPGGFSGPQDGLSDHVGIVEKVENGRVYTIEGNSGDKCCQRSYPVGYYEIYGYGQLCP